MNVFSKVLVVFVFLLSVGFAASQMVLHAKRQKYYKLYADTQTELTGARARANELEGQLEDTRAQYDKAARQLRETQDDLQQAKQTRDEEISRLKQQVTKLNNDLEGARKRVNNMVSLVQEQKDVIDNLETAKASLDSSLKEALKNNENLEKQVRRQSNQIDAHQKKIAQLQDNLEEVKDEKNNMENTLARLRGRGVEIFAGEQPMVDGKVVVVDEQVGAVVIDKGEGSKVQVGHEFTIYRGTEALAKASVVEVKPEHCVAQITEPGLFDKDKQIRVGDSATTQVW
jgi:septal ring factor EnvC (AmiA/AmiB activator)